MDTGRHLPVARFCYRLSPVRVGRSLWLVGVCSLIMVLALVFSQGGAASLLEALRELPPVTVIGVVLGAGGLAGLILFLRHQADEAYLVADDGGIDCRPHRYHGARVWTRHPWQLPWQSIRRAVVYRPGGKGHHIQSWVLATLVLHADDGDYRLGYLHWEPEDEALDRPHLMAWRPGKRMHALAESHPLIRMLAQKQVPVEFETLGFGAMRKLSKQTRDTRERAEAAGPVDLLSYPSLQAMLGLGGLLVLAAGAHFMMLAPLRALWVSDPGASVLAGSLACIAAFALAGRAPVRERAVVAVLLGALVGGLWQSLGTRAAVLLEGERETVAYRIEAPGRFRPVNAGYPEVVLDDLGIPEYWDSLAPDEDHEFVLIRIRADRYVLSLAEFFDRTSAFYAERESGEPAAEAQRGDE